MRPQKATCFAQGTVIETSGGKDFVRIFHAGFHEPTDWRGVGNDSQDTDYFEAIGTCIRQVLESVKAQRLSSVAFPLIGCGRFGLDEKMLILQFLDAMEALNDRFEENESVDVWLVIRERAQFVSAVAVFLELLLRARSEMIMLEIQGTGFPILDRFAARLGQRSNVDWTKWQLCRFTEIALEIMCYGLSRGILPSPTPESLFEEGKSPTFGGVRELAMKFAFALPTETNVWGAKFFSSVLKNKTVAAGLEAINAQRNNLAHGRTSMSLDEIKKMVAQSLQLVAWATISDADGELRLADWIPWVVTSATQNEQTGIFERWQKSAIRYLVPETGEIFKEPRLSTVS
jgi:O-acetyl-ADP-ribose deacetylase (regulator of RNase III)